MTSAALARADAPAPAVKSQEHRLAAVLIGLVVLAAALALAADRIRAPRVGRNLALALMTATLVLVLAAAAVVVVRAGGPEGAVHRALAAFRTGDTGGGSHVFSASGSNRSEYWTVAWREATAHPLLGGGAGSFGAWWLRLRPIDFGGLDAHELYLETLAELGAVGLLVLCCALAVPLAVLRRARRAPLGAACGAAYVAFLVHAAVDWDWELPAAGLAGVLCGAALLRAERDVLPLARPARGVGVAVAAALAAFVFVMHVGNVSLARSGSARDRGDLGAAVREARRAESWQPWSAEPALALGEAQLSAGGVPAAAASFRTAIARDRGDWEAWYQPGPHPRAPPRLPSESAQRGARGAPWLSTSQESEPRGISPREAARPFGTEEPQREQTHTEEAPRQGYRERRDRDGRSRGPGGRSRSRLRRDGLELDGRLRVPVRQQDDRLPPHGVEVPPDGDDLDLTARAAGAPEAR